MGMTLGVISDTHGNRKLMHQVAELMETQLGATGIVHLGDDYADAEELAMTGHPMRMVPGLWCPEYRNSRIPNQVVEQIEGVTIAYTHADKDLRHPHHAAAIILTGHTHAARLELIGRSMYMNPGHLKALRDRNQEASFGTITIRDDAVRAAIHTIQGAVLKELVVARACLG